MKKIYTQKIDSSEKEVNVIPLLKVLLKRWWIIILTGLIVGGATFAVTKIFINQTYRCGFTAYVNNKQVKQTTDILTSSDVTAAKELVRTYSHILKSDTVLSSAAESIKLNLKYADLSNMVYTEIQDETEIIAVYVVDENPLVAYDLAQAIMVVLDDFKDAIIHGVASNYEKTGIYHFSNEGVTSWYDFTKLIAELAGNTACNIQPCHSDEFPSPVKRPAYSVLDKTKIKEVFGIKVPYWTDSLKKCLSTML